MSLGLTGGMYRGISICGGDGGGDNDDAMDFVQHRGIDIVTYNVLRSKSCNGFQLKKPSTPEYKRETALVSLTRQVHIFQIN